MKILDSGSGPWKYPEAKPDIVWDLNVFLYPFNDNEFYLVHSAHILEHLTEPVRMLEEIWRILNEKDLAHQKLLQDLEF